MRQPDPEAATPEDQRAEIDRGYEFAEQLYVLVHTLPPKSLSEAEKAALYGHLLSTAIGWVQAHNRAKRAEAAA